MVHIQKQEPVQVFWLVSPLGLDLEDIWDQFKWMTNIWLSTTDQVYKVLSIVDKRSEFEWYNFRSSIKDNTQVRKVVLNVETGYWRILDDDGDK